MAKTHEHKRAEIIVEALADRAISLKEEGDRHYQAKCEVVARHANERDRRQVLEAELNRVKIICREVMEILAPISGAEIAAPLHRAYGLLSEAVLDRDLQE